MGQVKCCVKNILESSTVSLTAGTEDNNYPLYRIYDRNIGRKFKPTLAETIEIKIDQGASDNQIVDRLFIAGHNLASAGAEVEVLASDDDFVDDIINPLPNLLKYSQEFDNAAWVKRGVVRVTPNATTAPDGTLTAAKIENLGSSDTDDMYQYTNGIIKQRYEPSVWIKKISSTGVLRLNSYISGGAGSIGSWRIDFSRLGNGWERITRDHPAVEIVYEFVGSPGGYIGHHYYAESGTLNFYIWGAQVEENVKSSDYHPTRATPQKLSPLIDGILYTPCVVKAINLLKYSEEFDNAVWVKRGITTVTPNATTAPDGTLTADKIDIGVADTDDMYQIISGIIVGQRYEPSVWIKKISSSGILRLNSYISGPVGSWRIDFSQLGTDWERITRDHPAVEIVNEFVGDQSGYCGHHYYAESGTLSFYIWGAQLEEGEVTTVYQKTKGTTPSKTKRYWKIIISNPSIIPEIGEIFLSQTYEWEKNPQLPAGPLDHEFNVENEVSAGGQDRFLIHGDPKRQRVYSVYKADSIQKENILALNNEYQNAKPFWLCDHNGKWIFGKLRRPISLRYEDEGEEGGLYSFDFDFLEVLP
jgi:hypothetical protein